MGNAFRGEPLLGFNSRDLIISVDKHSSSKLGGVVKVLVAHSSAYMFLSFANRRVN